MRHVRTGAAVLIAVVLAACSGSSGSKVESTTTSRAKASPRKTTFPVDVPTYLERFNGLRVPFLNGTGVAAVVPVLPFPVAPDAVGSQVSAENSLYLVTSASGEIEAVVVTAPVKEALVAPPVPLLEVACGAVVGDGTISVAAAAAFTEAVPKLDNISPVTVVAIGSFYDVHLRLGASKGPIGNTVGFFCVPRGAPVPAAASALPL